MTIAFYLSRPNNAKKSNFLNVLLAAPHTAQVPGRWWYQPAQAPPDYSAMLWVSLGPNGRQSGGSLPNLNEQN